MARSKDRAISLLLRSPDADLLMGPQPPVPTRCAATWRPCAGESNPVELTRSTFHSRSLTRIRLVADRSPSNPQPFAEYHRARRFSAFGRAALVGIPVAALIAGAFALSSLAPATAASPQAETLAAIGPGHASASPSASPVPVASKAPTAPVRRASPVSAPSITWIEITATGYQHEIDECQWVRMDLDAEAPIVGAHTQCGGSPVLSMRPGDVVELDGEGLDGEYVVSDGRDAHAGDNAAAATSGMLAQVILQTCYPGAGGRERLIGLEPKG